VEHFKVTMPLLPIDIRKVPVLSVS